MLSLHLSCIHIEIFFLFRQKSAMEYPNDAKSDSYLTRKLKIQKILRYIEALSEKQLNCVRIISFLYAREKKGVSIEFSKYIYIKNIASCPYFYKIIPSLYLERVSDGTHSSFKHAQICASNVLYNINHCKVNG